MTAAQEYFTERAAIREHDGEQPRADAEQAAAAELVEARNIAAADKAQVLMHAPITHEQKIAGLGRLMADRRSRDERAAMYERLVKLHGKDIADQVREAQRQILHERRNGR